MALKKCVTLLLLMVKKPFFWLCKAIVVPVVGAIYFFYRAIKKRTAKISVVIRERALGFFANRYAIHAVVIILAFTVTTTNLYASNGNDQQQATAGSQSILGSIVQNRDDESVVVQGAGSPNVNEDGSGSYLSGEALTAQDAADNSGSVAASQDNQGVDSGAYQDDPSELLLEGGAESSPTANAVQGQSQMDDGSTPPTRTKVQNYVVADGDTIGSIAGKFGLHIETLLTSNGLNDRSVIHPGDNLRILPVDGVMYTVKSGDTISRIANRYGSDADKIMEANGLADASAISLGEELVLPDGKMPTPPPEATAKPLARLATGIKNIFVPDNSDRTPYLQQVADSGRMLWPTGCHYISQGYGVMEYFGALHTGIDIACPKGTPIYAALDGTVISAGWNNGGYGNMIILYHGLDDNGVKLFTRYGHSSKLLVKVGDQVARGQVIALVGSTGRSTGPHLHFEVMTNNPLHRLNPLRYITP
jgi:murein DD-endopeptidase MepM/ murein hydrolase activator NlpD